MYSPELNSALTHIRLLNGKLIMENKFLDKVENNAVVQLLHFWGVDLVPTIEEYTTLLGCPRIKVDKVYSKAINISTFVKKLMNILAMIHPDTKKKVDVFALSIYGLKIFPKALGCVDEAVTDLFDRLDKRVTPVPVILAETFRSLSACRSTGEGRFIECAEVPLLRIWGAIGYVPLLVLKQYRLRQFIPATQRLAQSEFSYKDDGYKKKIQEVTNAWKQIHRMKRLAVEPMVTPEYNEWWSKRVNDNIPKMREEDIWLIELYLQVVPSEIEIIKQDFENRNLELGKKIERLEEEKIQLGLDVDVQKLETDKWRKGKNKADEDLDNLKMDYKKLCRSIRTVGLGKTSEQWRQEIYEEMTKADQWEKKFQDARAREVALEKSLLECQNKKMGLKARIRERDYIMGEAVSQICEVADHLQTLAVQADVLSLKYESELD
ncbi:hypothetical protein Golax_025880 [Gossypium laxum]|uniref:DUF7745 domain-containing protein n=1 Tax=Gossypium laxum TaxID=34288 RepID=A0A7J9AYW0_9ROSI|nr:hypothetical protein [Gossypium laxum]